MRTVFVCCATDALYLCKIKYLPLCSLQMPTDHLRASSTFLSAKIKWDDGMALVFLSSVRHIAVISSPLSLLRICKRERNNKFKTTFCLIWTRINWRCCCGYRATVLLCIFFPFLFVVLYICTFFVIIMEKLCLQLPHVHFFKI